MNETKQQKKKDEMMKLDEEQLNDSHWFACSGSCNANTWREGLLSVHFLVTILKTRLA